MTTLKEIEELARQGDLDALARLVLFSFVQGNLRYGSIPTFGRSEAEITADIERFLQKFYRQDQLEGSRMLHVTDHRSDLLARAREFKKIDAFEESLLYYSTWVEHLLNDIVATVLRRRKFAEEYVSQVIRDVALRAKVSWLFPVLGLPQLEATLSSRILELADTRNAFVHFKFLARNVDEAPSQRERLAQLVAGAESVVSALEAYESEHVAGEARRLALRFVGLTE